MSTPYDPLREPGYTTADFGSLEAEIAVTRRILDETAPLNIHSNDDMLKAAVALDCRVRGLLAALDAKRGEGQ
ncbi:hypothetical protein [Streptomyces sp. SID12488]|uniref:hypothetical protein n=1 Tax=Streptomyces sp. SID12488 TaxID=2706040 RepID=UPI0013DA82F7|nr:hypothetical protein [Streptomyces sp. SID12488]NEA67531.1 hypothetical protein [Streptomyces sp. SID12488]